MKILFISHEATLSGAPLVLLNFIKWLKAIKPEVQTAVLFMTGGDRLADFEKAAGQVWVTPKQHKPHSKLFFLIKAVLKKINVDLRTHEQKFESEIIAYNPSLIYCNTVVTLKKGIDMKRHLPNAKLVLHVHELPTVIELVCKDFELLTKDVDLFIGASGLVTKSLVEQYKIESNKIKLVYEFVYPLKEDESMLSTKPHFTVGASGFVDWRKGYDVFISIAARFRKLHPEVEIGFVWVGKVADPMRIIIEKDLEKLGLKNIVTFTGEQKDAIAAFRSFDLFLMSSREDPFPLVCLEVAQMGIPIICFEKATGSAEMLVNGGGKVVPYLDIEQAVQVIYDYHEDKEMLRNDAAIIKAQSQLYLVDQMAPTLYEVIKDTVHGRV